MVVPAKFKIMQQSKQIHIIAGPNGAGKTTNARIILLPQFLQTNQFINADEIAKNLSPEDPKRSSLEAGRLMIHRLNFMLQEGQNFAFETTLSAKNYIKFIENAKKMGYKVNLFFLALDNPQLAQQRVITRVSKGGHNIEPAVINRRFERGLENLKDYLNIVDSATIYEASNLELIEIAKKYEGKLEINDSNLWKKIYERQ